MRIRYLVAQEGYHHWRPGRHARALGFRSVALGPDFAVAAAAAEKLNAELDAARAAGAPSPGAAAPAGRTVKALIAKYKASEEYLRLAPKTQDGYDQALAIIERWSGDLLVAALTAGRIKGFYRTFRAATPAYANAVLRVLRLLLKFAIGEDWLASNPARDVAMIGTPPRQVIWPHDAARAYVRLADALGLPALGDAVMVALWLAQREGDVIALGRARIRDGTHVLLQQRKTARWIDAPLFSELRERVEAIEARRRQREQAAAAAVPPRSTVAATTLIACDTTGRPFKEDHFRHEFATVRDLLAGKAQEKLARLERTPPDSADGRSKMKRLRRLADAMAAAGIAPVADWADPYFVDTEGKPLRIRTEDLWFEDLRRTGIVTLGEAGCDATLISSISGHQIEQVTRILEVYLPRTRKMAAAAIEQLEAHRARQAEEG